jgi:ribosomal protein S8/ribosomal protein L6P/L9E
MKNLTERVSNLRNAQRLGRKQLTFFLPFGVAANSFRRNFFQLLVREGYLESFSSTHISTSETSSSVIFTISLKYGPCGEPAIRSIHPISLSGRRVYLSAASLWQPQFLNGTLILSTPRGLLTDREARYFGVGGEVLRGVRLLMLSLPVPSSIILTCIPGYLHRSGPRGSFRTVTGPYKLRILETASTRRLFLEVDPSVLPEARPSLSAQAARLSRLAGQRNGLARGYRRRLRLVGVGFRATRVDNLPRGSSLSLKLGYSHDVERGLSSFSKEGVSVTPSRLEGRTKGTLLSLEGADLSALNQAAASLRSLRHPDPYKGKGIQYDRENIILKKGKREGLFYTYLYINGLTLFSTLRYCSSCQKQSLGGKKFSPSRLFFDSRPSPSTWWCVSPFCKSPKN